LMQYFNGYGDSLVDYNRHQQRIGFGIQLKFI
jgi:phospholipase A1